MGPIFRGLAGARTGAGWALSFLTTEVRGLHAAAYILALSSLTSSILALLRDRLLAHLFGAGPQLDMYYAAFRIPDAVFIGIGALVSAYMLIPEIARRDEEGQKRYLDTIVVGYSALVAIVAAGAAFAAPAILTNFFPFLAATNLEELIFLSRILLLQAVLLGFSNIMAAITQFKHRYTLYAVSPIVYNLGIMFGALALYPQFGLPGLICGVVIGAALHLAIQIPSIIGDGFFRRLPHFTEAAAFLDTVRLSLPRALALSMNQLAFFGLLSLAGTLSIGSISIFMFAYNLQGVPLSIIGASYATAAFPTLAYAFSRGESDEYLTQVAIAARQILFWSLPLIALTIVLRAHIVRAILGTGAFDWTDTRLTAAALALFAISLAAQGITLLLIRALYAAGKTMMPFIVSGLTAALTIIFGVWLLVLFSDERAVSFIESFLRVQDVPGAEVLALALAYSLSSLIGVCLLALYFAGNMGTFFSHIGRSLLDGLIAAFAAGFVSYATLNAIGNLELATTFGEILLKGGSAALTGLAAAIFTYYALGNREFAENVAALRKRIWREAEPVISAEQSA
jgi:putative peptidoglycan lipid II flippase